MAETSAATAPRKRGRPVGSKNDPSKRKATPTKGLADQLAAIEKQRDEAAARVRELDRTINKVRTLLNGGKPRRGRPPGKG